MSMLRFDRLTIKAQEAVLSAQKIAEEHAQQQVDVEHLALALLEQKDGIITPLHKKLGANVKQSSEEIAREIKRYPQISGPGALGQLYISPRLRDLLDRAQMEADRLRDEYLSTEHLFLAILSGDGPAVQVLPAPGINKSKTPAGLGG